MQDIVIVLNNGRVVVVHKVRNATEVLDQIYSANLKQNEAALVIQDGGKTTAVFKYSDIQAAYIKGDRLGLLL